MRKFNPRYLYTAAATAAITAAVIAIPAWAASGGGDSTAQGQASTTAPAPPPFAYGLTRANAPSAAEMKQSRAKLDQFASCLKDHGIDVPTPGSTAQLQQAPQPPSSSEMQKVTKDCGTPPAPPGLPPLSKKQADAAQKAMAKGDCPRPPALPAPSGSSGS
jgi:hypothetical protein